MNGSLYMPNFYINDKIDMKNMKDRNNMKYEIYYFFL